MTSRPSSRTVPPCGRSRPATAASVLVLPAPFGPIRVTTCAGIDPERDPAHRLDVAVGDLEVADLEERRARRAHAAASPPR